MYFPALGAGCTVVIALALNADWFFVSFSFVVIG